MGAVIINTALNAGQKVLRESERLTEDDGLVLLTETYIIRSADIESIEPDRNTPHTTFSTATNKYARMQVETTRVEPMDGGLATLVVNYVGLDYASGLPSAFVTAVGQPGVGVFGADASVVVKYVTEQPVFDLLKGSVVNLTLGRLTLSANYANGSTFLSTTPRLLVPSKRLMPSSINGTLLPPNPRQREYRARLFGILETREWLYAGYVQTSINFKRRGMFNQIEEQFSEYFRASDIFYTSDGLINIDAVNAVPSSGLFF